ncbi:MAG: hypothetical protein IIC79_03025 [Chloroflexi bacterium]|nr:hypothetical protein [Chloroflexota bacterium]
MKVLALGTGAVEIAENKLWPGEDVEQPRWNIYAPPKKYNRKYARILAYFVLPRVANLAVVDTLSRWRGLLQPGGELHVHVPSAEWFAREILNPQQPSPFALQHLFGLQVDEDSFYLSAFTLARLRQDMDAAGLAVEYARVYPYQFIVNETAYQAEQHHVMGVRA